MEGSYIAARYLRALPSQTNKAFKTLLSSKYSSNYTVTQQSAIAYGMVHAWADAADRAQVCTKKLSVSMLPFVLGVTFILLAWIASLM